MDRNHVDNAKHNGAANELLFMVECMKRGWKVSLPFGEDCRYDVVVDTPKGLRRVQVKSCNKPDERGRYRVNAGHGRKYKTAYKTDDCDVVAVYVAPLKHWWIVPTGEIKCTQLDLSLHHNDCYNAWQHIYNEN